MPKLKLVELNVLLTPVPLRVAVWAAALRLPLRTREAVGVNVTEIVQFAPAPRLAGQLLVWAKSPVTEIPVSTARLPELDSVNVCGTLATANCCKLKLALDGLNVASTVPMVYVAELTGLSRKPGCAAKALTVSPLVIVRASVLEAECADVQLGAVPSVV